MSPATSESEKVRFHTLNRATGNRVVSQYVDSITGKPVKDENEAKGYPRGENDYVILTEDDLDVCSARHRSHDRHRKVRAGRIHRLDLSGESPLPHA